MGVLENDKILKLYELSVNEEHYFLDAHQSRATFYSGFISALVVGTVAGLLRANDWKQLVAICAGPILIFIISKIALKGCFRFYQRYIETVTIRAKIEQELGLTRCQLDNTDETDFYWQSEPIIPFRHINSRKTYNTSDDFIKQFIDKGYQHCTKVLFWWFQILSIVIFFWILYLILRLAICN